MGAREPVAFAWERLTGEPLIYASMGTAQNGLLDVFRKIMEAVERPGYQLVLSVGMNIAPESVPAKQPNTVIVQRAAIGIAATGYVVRDPCRAKYHARVVSPGCAIGSHSDYK